MTTIESNKQTENLLYVFTDIETDNLTGKYLLQIAAVTQDGLKFNVYVNPMKPLALPTTRFLGLYWYKGDLYRDGAKLDSKYITDALHAFMQWIRRLNKPVMLCYHNGFAFDIKVLVRKLLYFQTEIPENLVSVGDTLPFFRQNLKPPAIENHKLSTLLSHFKIVLPGQLHDALVDSVILKLICEKYIEDKNSSLETIFKDNNKKFSDYILNLRDGVPMPKVSKKKVKTKNNDLPVSVAGTEEK